VSLSVESLLNLQRASFGYGRRAIVSGVDLRVGPGELIGLVGPNGSGKTTLFRGILGLLPALTGRVERPASPMGYVPQKDNLDKIFPLRVDEVVRMGGVHRLRGLRRVRTAERELALECLERVRLVDQTRKPFAELSGGQRQRALIARALMVQSKLLLLDEPTSGIDDAAQGQVVEVLRQLHLEGVAILIVSHQISLLRELVDRVVWVEGGFAREVSPEVLCDAQRLEGMFEGRPAGSSSFERPGA
jgi:ABC-type Mn2+/Zn2+ transport system ATPase subunit